MLGQNQNVEGSQKEYDYFTKKKTFELERELKDTSKSRFDLEGDLRALENEFGREEDENYDHTMAITKDKEFEALEIARHKL